MANYRGSTASYRRRHDGGNFRRSIANVKYYSYGSQAARVEEEKDNVTLKYYGRLVKIENKVVARGSAGKVFCALIICACAIIVIFAKCMTYNYQMENAALSSKLDEARETTESIIANSTEKIDMAYVEQEATARLNMAKPQSFQIVYIEVPKSDYTVLHEATTVVEKEKIEFISFNKIVSSLLEAGEELIANENGER